MCNNCNDCFDCELDYHIHKRNIEKDREIRARINNLKAQIREIEKAQRNKKEAK